MSDNYEIAIKDLEEELEAYQKEIVDVTKRFYITIAALKVICINNHKDTSSYQVAVKALQDIAGD